MAKAEDDKQVSLELQGGSNLTRIKKDAGKLYTDIKKLKIKRAEINAQISAHRENLKSMGIPRSSQSEVERRDDLDVEKRREHDFGVQVFGEAIAKPVDLFTPFDDVRDQEPAAKPKAATAKKKPAKKAGKDKSRSLAGLDGAIKLATTDGKPVDSVVAKAEKTSAERAKLT